MGKRQIGEMQPFELVITLIIADLATIPMGDTALPILHGIIPLFTLCIIHFGLSFISRKSWKMRQLISGKPVIVIGPNGIDYQALKKLNMTFNDLIEVTRTAGYFNLDEILYAIIQTNGAVSVLPRAPFAPLTPDDMDIKKEPSALPIIVLSEGKLQKENADLAKITEQFLADIVLKAGLNFGLKQIMLITLNQKGEFYIQPKQGEFKTYASDYNGGGNW